MQVKDSSNSDWPPRLNSCHCRFLIGQFTSATHPQPLKAENPDNPPSTQFHGARQTFYALQIIYLSYIFYNHCSHSINLARFLTSSHRTSALPKKLLRSASTNNGGNETDADIKVKDNQSAKSNATHSNVEKQGARNATCCEPLQSRLSAFSSLGFLDRFLAVESFLVMFIGIILRNAIDDVGPALQNEAFVSVSLPIGASSGSQSATSTYRH